VALDDRDEADYRRNPAPNPLRQISADNNINNERTRRQVELPLSFQLADNWNIPGICVFQRLMAGIIV